MNKVLISSDSDEWGTPQKSFDRLNKIFNFTIDIAATKENTKCELFITKEMNAPFSSMIVSFGVK